MNQDNQTPSEPTLEDIEIEIKELKAFTEKFRGDQSTLNELKVDLENLIVSYYQIKTIEGEMLHEGNINVN